MFSSSSAAAAGAASVAAASASSAAAAAAASAVPSNATSCVRRLRVLHATDLHFLVRPSLATVLRQPKRLIGVTNLFLLRRASKFSLDIQNQLVDRIRAARPDVLLLSGDITTLATEDEMRLARERLHPLLDNNGSFPTFIVPGNHDAYTPDSVSPSALPGGAGQQPSSGTRDTPAAALLRKYFGPWMERVDLEREVEPWQWNMSSNPARFRAQVERQQKHFIKFRPQQNDASSSASASAASSSSSSSAPSAPLPFLPVFAYDFLRFVGLNPCRPTLIGSKGAYDERQLAALDSVLANPPQTDATAEDIAPWHPNSIESSASSPASPAAAPAPAAPLPLSSAYTFLVGHYPILDGSGGPYELAHPWHAVVNGSSLRSLLQRPSNRVLPHAFLHGHVHRGFQDQLPLHDPTRHMLVLNPGSAGQTFSEKKKRCAAFNIYDIRIGGPIDAAEQSMMEDAASQQMGQQQQTDAASSTEPSERRSYALSLPAPSRSVRPLTPLHANSTPFRVPSEHKGARGGVHSVYQRSADEQQRYFVTVERWIHDGERFVQEEFPYTSGF